MAAPTGPYPGIQQPAYPAGGFSQQQQPQPTGFYPTAGQFPSAPQQSIGPPQPQVQQQGDQNSGTQSQPQGVPQQGPSPTQPTIAAATPASAPPAKRGFFNFLRRGNAASQNTQQQAAGQQQPQQPGAGGPSANPNDPEAGSQPPQDGTGSQGEAGAGGEGQQATNMQTPEEKDPASLTMVSYDSCCMPYEEPPIVTESLLLTFDVQPLGKQPKPLPQRLTAEQEGRTQREELGLYRERQCVLSEHSLNKLEQRITKSTTLDKNLLMEIGSGNAAAAEQQVAITAQRYQQQQQQIQQQQQQAQQQQQLTVGNLPTVTEEPEGPQTEGGAEGPQLLKLPPMPEPLLQPGQAEEATLQPGGVQGQAAVPADATQEQQLQQQQQQLGGPLTVGANVSAGGAPVKEQGIIQDPLTGLQWLDENGLMIYVPDPLKRPGRERPPRRSDQYKELLRSKRWKPLVEVASRSDARLYRLDIELGRLEFLVHPAMAQEDLLAARMLALFRDFKRRESVGLVMFYASRLAALEDSMLGAREKLFMLLQATEGAQDDILDAYAMLAKIEREVAEVRQLKEEEEALLTRTVRSMERLYSQIVAVRQQQGYALTNLELRVLTRPPQELAWQQGILTRERLDALLVAAEMEEIAGLPKFPEAYRVPDLEDLPLPGAMAEGNRWMGPVPGMGMAGPGLMDPLAAATAAQQKPYVFRPRRCECMCAAHAAALADITAALETLKGRSSTDPEDASFKELEEKAALVGRAPRRVAMATEEQDELHAKAMEKAKAGEVYVSRMPHLVPILTLSASDNVASLQHQMPPLGPGQVAAGAPVPLTQPPPPKPNLKQGGKGKYYVKLYVNGHYVDSSDVSTLGDNFVADLKDIFTIQVSRFPESISAMIFERHTLRDSYLGQVYIAVPGLAGTPHVDAQPRPYQFTALAPFRPRLALEGPGPVPLMPDATFQDPAYNFNTIFPTGIIYARCGWVSDRVVPGTRLADTVQPNATITYDNPLAERPPPGQSHAQTARLFSDIEAGKSLMPPRATVPIDRMLRRAAERIGGKANRAQIMRWLSEHVIDPNDPRNAPLLELLKTQEAAASALGDLFRLDIFPDVAMRADRAADKRMSVLARRWQAGIYRAPDKNLLKGVRSVAIPAPLDATETDKLDNQYLDQLAMLEEASQGTQMALARVMMARHEKAMQLQIGAILTREIKQREDNIRDFVIRVRAAAARMADGQLMARRFRTEDVVRDEPLPQFKLDLAMLSQLLAPRRPLKRTRKLIKSLMTSVPRETVLLVTIQRAANLPERQLAAPGAGGGGRRAGGEPAAIAAPTDDEDLSDEAEAKLRNCFVEVRFRSLTQRTVAVPGEFPIFNEQMELDVFRDDGSDQTQKALDDGVGLEPSPSALQENSDLITFNVFDELIMEQSETGGRRRRISDDGVNDPVRLPQRERRFLGCIRVPLSSVYQLQVLQGTFRLETPPVVLGYLQTSARPATLTLHLTMRPTLAAPAGELDERVTSSEQGEVNRHAQRWLAGLLARTECRSRVLKVMAVDADGSAVLVCRYLAPTMLPKHLADLANSLGTSPGVQALEALLLRVARFVAHVPYMEDSGIQKRRNDVWTTNAELIYLCGGDYEEHAHLLAGYFLQLGVQCFVVMGTSICGARSHFVLTTGQPLPPPSQPQAPQPSLNLNPQMLRLWNPVTGSVVSVKDASGEMREVGQLYDNHNIWANTQPTGRPWEMRWNLGAGKDWHPFFGPVLPPREIASIQTKPKYTELHQNFYKELEARVEKRVEEALSKARANFVTRPDNKVSRMLKQLLTSVPKTYEDICLASLAASAELAETQGKGPTEAPSYLGKRFELIAGLQQNHNERIRREARAESVNGHIVAMAFSDNYLEAVSEAITNTGIHRIADERVTFSTAVFVERLNASFVCCIWIYVAAIRG